MTKKTTNMLCNKNGCSQRAKILKMFSFPLFPLVLLLLFLSDMRPLEAAVIRNERETVSGKVDFSVEVDGVRNDPDIVNEATQSQTTTTAAIKVPKTTLPPTTELSNHAESESVKILSGSKLAEEASGAVVASVGYQKLNRVTVAGDSEFVKEKLHKSNDEIKMFQNDAELLYENSTTTSSTLATLLEMTNEAIERTTPTTVKPTVEQIVRDATPVEATTTKTAPPLITTATPTATATTPQPTSTPTHTNDDTPASHSQENSIDETQQQKQQRRAGAAEKRGKFISDNSTNAQQLNLPNTSEVWSLVGMKTLPTLNASNGVATVSTELANEIELQTLPVAAQNRTVVSEKIIHDWQQIMMAGEKSSHDEKDSHKSLELELESERKQDSQTEFILNSTLDATDAAVTEAASVAAYENKVTTPLHMLQQWNEVVGSTSDKVTAIIPSTTATTITTAMERLLLDNNKSPSTISSLSETNTTLTTTQANIDTIIDKLDNATTTMNGSSNNSSDVSEHTQLENNQEQIININSNNKHTQTADLTLTTTMTMPMSTSTSKPAVTESATTVAASIEVTHKTTNTAKAEQSLSEADEMQRNKFVNGAAEVNSIATTTEATFASLERISSEMPVSTPVTSNESTTKTSVTTQAILKEESEKEDEKTTTLPILVTSESIETKQNEINTVKTTEVLPISNEVNLVTINKTNEIRNTNNIKEEEKVVETSANINTETTTTAPSAESTTTSLNGNEPNELLIAAATTTTTNTIKTEITSTLATPTTSTTTADTTTATVTAKKIEQVVESTTARTTKTILTESTTAAVLLESSNDNNNKVKVNDDTLQQQPQQIHKTEERLKKEQQSQIHESSIETNKISETVDQELSLLTTTTPITTTTTSTITTTYIATTTFASDEQHRLKNVQETNANSLAETADKSVLAAAAASANEHEDDADILLSKITTTTSNSMATVLETNTTASTSTTTTTTTTTEEPSISLLDDSPTTKSTASSTTTAKVPTSISTKIEEVYKLITSSTSTSTPTTTTTIATETPVPAYTSTRVPVSVEVPSSSSYSPPITTINNMLPKLEETTSTTTPSSQDFAMQKPTMHFPTMGIDNLQSKTDAGETDVNVIIAITVSVIGVVALILLVAFLYLMRKRQKQMSYGQRCRPVSLDAYSLDNVSVLGSVRRKGAALRASKRSYGNAAFDDPALRHNVLNATELAKFLERRSSIFEEFRDVPQIIARADEVPTGCEDKNRYANVIPLPETRVILQQQQNDEKTEYINANYVRGPKDAPNYYIACQAPLESTVADFWRMIWEQQSRVIIQASDLIENGIDKCAEYLPPSVTLDNHTTYGEYQVTLKHREVKDKYAISTLMLKHIVENTSRELTHYWYKWPETGVPNEEAPIIAMLLEVRSSLKSYAIEQANELKEKSSTLTIKSLESSGSGAEPTVEGTPNKVTATPVPSGSNSISSEINGNVMKTAANTARNQGPLTIHCSPGTGRTGTIIACDMAIRSLETPKRSVDIPQIVYYVRRGRASAVQTKEQYEFIYKVANMYASKITNTSNDN